MCEFHDSNCNGFGDMWWTDNREISFQIGRSGDFHESSQICPFLAGRPQFESVHHQNRRLSSHSYSHESVIFFVFLGLLFFKLRRVCVFEFNCTRLRAAVDNGALRLSPLYYDREQQVAHSSRPHAESIIFNRGRSVAIWTFTGRVFHSAQRPSPVERAPACSCQEIGPPPNAVWLLLSSAPFLALLTRSGVVYLVNTPATATFNCRLLASFFHR